MKILNFNLILVSPLILLPTIFYRSCDAAVSSENCVNSTKLEEYFRFSFNPSNEFIGNVMHKKSEIIAKSSQICQEIYESNDYKYYNPQYTGVKEPDLPDDSSPRITHVNVVYQNLTHDKSDLEEQEEKHTKSGFLIICETKNKDHSVTSTPSSQSGVPEKLYILFGYRINTVIICEQIYNIGGTDNPCRLVQLMFLAPDLIFDQLHEHYHRAKLAWNKNPKKTLKTSVCALNSQEIHLLCRSMFKTVPRSEVCSQTPYEIRFPHPYLHDKEFIDQQNMASCDVAEEEGDDGSKTRKYLISQGFDISENSYSAFIYRYVDDKIVLYAHAINIGILDKNNETFWNHTIDKLATVACFLYTGHVFRNRYDSPFPSIYRSIRTSNLVLVQVKTILKLIRSNQLGKSFKRLIKPASPSPLVYGGQHVRINTTVNYNRGVFAVNIE